MRIRAVGTRGNVKKGHLEEWDGSAVKELWGWANPTATARACPKAVWDEEQGVKGEKWSGCEVFNIAAPTTSQPDKTSEDLAKQDYPNTDYGEKLLGWTHDEKE